MDTPPQYLLDTIFTIIARLLELDPTHIIRIYQKSNGPKGVGHAQWGAQFLVRNGEGKAYQVQEGLDDEGNEEIYELIQTYWTERNGENESKTFRGISNVVTAGMADLTWPSPGEGEEENWQAFIVLGVLNGQPFTGRVEENGNLVEMMDGEEIDMGDGLYFVASAWDDDEDEEEDADSEDY